MPIRAPEVVLDPSFTACQETLRERYKDIDTVVESLREDLLLGYALPMVLANPKTSPCVYLIVRDYPPHGSAGRGRFLVTLHATHPHPSPIAPYRIFTLLTLSERPKRLRH